MVNRCRRRIFRSLCTQLVENIVDDSRRVGDNRWEQSGRAFAGHKRTVRIPHAGTVTVDAHLANDLRG